MTNWTKETSDTLQYLYQEGAERDISMLAKMFRCSERSIIAKLVNLKIYRASQVQNTPQATKAELAAKICRALSIEVSEVPNLEKLTKSELTLLVQQVLRLEQQVEFQQSMNLE